MNASRLYDESTIIKMQQSNLKISTQVCMELIKLGEEPKSIKVHSYPSTSVQMGVAVET